MVVANEELAKALAFQCRVGDGNGIEDTTAASNKLLRRIVASLGSSIGAGAGDSMDISGAVETSWWGANLKERFIAAVMWVGTQGTRTPLHADDRPQFLIQLAGDKHVTLFPKITVRLSLLCWSSC